MQENLQCLRFRNMMLFMVVFQPVQTSHLAVGLQVVSGDWPFQVAQPK
ncbi:MAG: hypothetical protein JWM11_3802 [Planctomycetaceae bacterium]|nr:hypothetical protein [Planctomycetaceae bacterium]